jgi:hypothetical protein
VKQTIFEERRDISYSWQQIHHICCIQDGRKMRNQNGRKIRGKDKNVIQTSGIEIAIHFTG